MGIDGSGAEYSANKGECAGYDKQDNSRCRCVQAVVCHGQKLPRSQIKTGSTGQTPPPSDEENQCLEGESSRGNPSKQ